MKHFIIFLSTAFIVMTTTAAYTQQKDRNLAGTIVNEHQQPVAGAVIMLNGSYNDATASDAKGAFTFNVPADKVVYLRVRLKEEVNIIKVKPGDKTINIIWDKATAAASVVNLEEIKKKEKL